MSRNKMIAGCLLGCLFLCMFASAKDTNKFPAASPFEDAPLPLVPKTDRDQTQTDRIDAAAMYAHGRMLFRRQKFAEAIRRYQRAWRYDPNSRRVLDEILQLALGLKRNGEFMRYAVIKAERHPSDAITLRRIGDYLTEQQDFDRALAMFERSLAMQKDEEKDGTVILVRLQMGRLYFISGETKKAAKQFEVVVESLNDPKRFGLNDELKKSVLRDPNKTYRLFGEAFLAAGQLDESEKMFRQANHAKADKPLLAFMLARIANEREQYDEALKHLADYFESGSDTAKIEPYELLGELLTKTMGDEKKAKTELRARVQALCEKKPNTSLRIFVAQRALDADDLDLAAKVFEELDSEKPSVTAFQGLIDVQRRRQDPENLLNVLGKTILQSGTFEVFGDSVTSISEDDGLMSKLIEVADGQVQTDGNTLSDGVALAVAQLAVGAKKFDVADKYYAIAVEQKKPGKRQVIMTWGLDLFMAEQNEAAVKVFQRGIDEKVNKADSPDLHFYLAGALEMSGQTDKAIETAKKAVSIQPKQARLHGRVPWIMYHAKRYADAEKAYAELLKRFDKDHDSPGTRDAMRSARLALSNLCVVQERLSESEEWLEQVLDEFPEDIGAMNDLGYLWADQNKRLDRALVMVQKAVAEEPDNEAYRDSLGWAYYRLERYDEAVEQLQDAAKGEEPDGVILDHLGDAYLKTDQVDKALETWKRAAKAFKKSEEEKFLKKTEEKIKQHSAE